MMTCHFNHRYLWLDIEPKGKARHRSRAVADRTGRAYSRAYQDPKQKQYVQSLAMLIRDEWKEPILDCPVEVQFTAHMPIPKSWSIRHKEAANTDKVFYTSKPDIDNLEKMLFDCMNGIVWKDDAQVYSVTKLKRYSREVGWYVLIKWREL